MHLAMNDQHTKTLPAADIRSLVNGLDPAKSKTRSKMRPTTYVFDLDIDL